MPRKLENSLAVVLAAVLIIGLLVDIRQGPPDFAAIEDIPSRKQAFFDYLKPVIEDINSQRAAERQKLVAMLEALRAGERLSYLQRRQLKFWAQRYEIDFDADNLLASAEDLLLHLDQIPASMVLAQAAMESAWGTSRFVSDGYNFFGQWCFQEGCGMVPSERPQGASHEVKTFDDPRQAVYAYFRNINSHPAYKQVRKIRAQARQAGEAPSGLAMIAGLQQYSQRGQAYINELRSVIRFNDLE